MRADQNPVLVATPLNIVPLILITVGIGLMAWPLPFILHARPSKPSVVLPAAKPSPATGRQSEDLLAASEKRLEVLGREREALKDRLDALTQQAAQTQWLLSIVLAVGGLLTLAQGVFAFFSAQNYVKQADDALRKAERSAERMDALAQEIRTKYPIFSAVEDARQSALKELSTLAQRLNKDENLYTASNAFTRQNIISLESFAAIQFLSSEPRYSSETVNNLRLLARFYADRYTSKGRIIDSDLERALYYLSVALQKSDHDTCILNDLGWLHAHVAAKPDLDKARFYFEESLRSDPDQQRPLYDLGTMFFDASSKSRLLMSRDYLERAKGAGKWEKTPNDEFVGSIYYNLACVCSRLSEHAADETEKESSLESSIDMLRKAAEMGTTAEATVSNDLESDDLQALQKSGKYKDEIQDCLLLFKRRRVDRAKIAG